LEEAPPVEWQVENVGLTIAVVVALFGVYYLVAWWARRRTHDTADLWVAGRSISAPVNGMALTATWLSLATTLGVVALIIREQVPFVFMWVQWTLSIPLIVLLFGTQLRRLGAFTPATFMRHRYGQGTAVIAAIVMIVVLLMYALGNIVGIAKVFETLLDLPYFPALIIASIAVTGYVTLGGMYGITYNDALQMLVMAITIIVPLMMIMKSLDAGMWWFPQFGYAEMTDAMLKVFPGYFDMTYSVKWYVAIVFGLTLGAIGMPHLAIRVFTASSVASARRSLIWYVFFTGMIFTAVYALGFVGVYYFTTEGIEFPLRDADKTTMILNLAFNPDWVVAFVFAGIIAAGISSVAAHMLGIAALMVHDVVRAVKPDLAGPVQLRLGYVVIFLAGVAATVLALDPPPFLVVNIFWAFGLCATCITPQLILGTWSTRVNGYGAIVSMIVCMIVYVAASPYVFPNLVIGSGLTAQFGLAAALVTVPLGFLLTIVVSLAAERLPGVETASLRRHAQGLVEAIHGWPGAPLGRYAGTAWLLALAAGALVFIAWGLAPWPAPG